MVFVTEELDKFKQYAEMCRIGTYSERPVENGTEVRVMAGRFGYRANFTEEQNAKRQELVKWCRIQGFIEIVDVMDNEMFHGV